MRQHLFNTLLALILVFAASASKAQTYTITSHTEYDSCKNGLAFFVQTNTSNSNLTFTTYFGDGNSQTNPIPQTFGFANHTYSLPGTYTVKHILKLSGVPVDSVQFSATTTLCAYVGLRMYNDANTNCTYDISTESPVYSPIKIEIDSAGHKDTVNVTGWGSVKVFQGKTYTFKLLTTPLGASAICPSTGTITLTIPTTSAPVNIDFGFQCGTTSAFDLAVSHMRGLYRPVSTSYMYLSVTNSSCSPKSGVLTVNINPEFTYQSATPTPASVTGNTVTWNVTNLTSSSFAHFQIALTPVDTPALGDTLCATAIVTPTTGDANPANNALTVCDSVVASFDPNEKEVSPKGAVMPGTKLSYTIHFENLGNDTAFNIYVLDTLSEHLDANSMEMTAFSHRVTSSIIEGANGEKILRFDFADIRLPYTNSPEYNKGYVKFNINMKKNLPANTQIHNRAGIYFDINPVVMTNQVTNWIDPNNIKQVVKMNEVAVYPNPTDGVLTIKADIARYNEVKLVSTMGQLVMVNKLSGNETTIDINKLASGIYYLLLSGPGGTIAERIEKQ
jgi:uncharacterized repeat protein (TIGR01451 family)